MPYFSVAKARTQLADLINIAISGEDVVVTRDGRPVVRIQPFHQSSPPTAGLAGSLTGVIQLDPETHTDAPDAGTGHSVPPAEQ